MLLQTPVGLLSCSYLIVFSFAAVLYFCINFNSTSICFCNSLKNIHLPYYLHDFLPLFWQEPPAWDKSHKGAGVRGGAGLQRGDRGVNQQESLQELKQRFMARLQQVGNPSQPCRVMHQQCVCFRLQLLQH